MQFLVDKISLKCYTMCIIKKGMIKMDNTRDKNGRFKKGITPKNKLSHSDWYSKNKDKIREDIVFLSEYVKSTETITVKFSKCGHITEMLPGNIVKRYGCKHCAGKQKISQEKFEKMFKKVDLYSEYTLISEYKGMEEKIKVSHNCGYEYNVTALKFIHSEKRCPKCNDSKGEKHIFHFLKNKDIEFERQYKFDDCRLKNKLPFDFAVFEDEQLLYLIEYQGEQHYRPRDFFGGKEGFEYQKLRDKIKKEYCLNNNIPLIEIPYWVKSPSKRLIQELNKLGITNSLNT